MRHVGGHSEVNSEVILGPRISKTGTKLSKTGTRISKTGTKLSKNLTKTVINPVKRPCKPPLILITVYNCPGTLKQAVF